jgi:hypothetical protein
VGNRHPPGLVHGGDDDELPPGGAVLRLDRHVVDEQREVARAVEVLVLVGRQGESADRHVMPALAEEAAAKMGAALSG